MENVHRQEELKITPTQEELKIIPRHGTLEEL